MNPQSPSELNRESLLSEEGYKAARLAELFDAVPYLWNSIYVLSPELEEEIPKTKPNHDMPPEFEAQAETQGSGSIDSNNPAYATPSSDTSTPKNSDMDIEAIRKMVAEA